MREVTRGRAGIRALAVALAAALGAAPGCRRAPTTPAADAGAAPTSLGPFRVGREVAARLTLRLGFGMAGGASQDLRVVARWSATPTEIEGGVAELLCRLSDVGVTLAAGTGAPDEARARAERELAAALARPFYVAARADGAVEGLWFPAATNPAVENVLVTIASAQELARPASAAAQAAWIVEERDANGTYLAAYDATPARVRKQKARYVGGALTAAVAAAPGTTAAPTTPPAPRVASAETTFTTDAAGRVLEVRARESLVIALGPGAPTFETSSELTLEGATTSDAAAAIGAFARDRAGLSWRPMEQVSSDGQAQRLARDRVVLGAAGPAELHAALDALPLTDRKGGPAADELERRFEALYRLTPRAAVDAPALVRTVNAPRAKVVLDALTLARTPEAAVALGAIAVDAKASSEARGYALMYLGQHDHPPEAAVAALASLLDDPDAARRQAARFAYGACALKLRADAPARAEAITADLLARLARATDADRADLVAALGNAGSARALPALRAALASPDATTRSRAANALRFVDDPSVDPLLTTLLLDHDAVLRRAAVDAIRFRDIGPFADPLAAVARRDAEPSVRGAATALLGDRMRDLPTLRAVLEDVRAHDPAPANRALAARYVGAPPARAAKP